MRVDFFNANYDYLTSCTLDDDTTGSKSTNKQAVERAFFLEEVNQLALYAVTIRDGCQPEWFVCEYGDWLPITDRSYAKVMMETEDDDSRILQ
tara:strand:+ start:3150 stop:3428 length:279 start_codon:yes stop_codon:yes gene_type:complete